MTLKTLDQRLTYIDHLRGFMFIVMALDHALHAYALNWGKFWFFRDYNRSVAFDAFYVHDQNIIMPMLFFIFGMFVIPSLLRRGLFGYLKERFLRFGIIYLIGVPLIVPMLSYPRYETYEEPGIGYLEFCREIFFGERFQVGPFWVLHGLMAFTLLTLIIYYVLPPIYNMLVRFFKWCFMNPVTGFLLLAIKMSVILFVSDLFWGAPWWFNFGWVFSLQASKMILIFICFLAGSALMSSGVLRDEELMQKFANQWPKFMVMYAFLAFSFMTYSVSNYDLAYNEFVRKYAFQNGGWFEAGGNLIPVIKEYAGPIFIRTFLQGFLCLTQILLLLSLFKKYFDSPTPQWQSLAKNAFGLFILHETIVVWMQYYLNSTELPLLFKFLLCASVGISVSWFLSARVFNRIWLVERLISPKPKGVL